MANDTFLTQGFPNDGLLHDQSDWWSPQGWGLTNGRGSSVTTGNVVVINTSAETFDVTTTAADLRPVGVVPYDNQGTTRDGSTEQNDKTIANGEIGAIQLAGYCEEIDVDGSVGVGEYLTTGTTAGKATGSGITIGESTSAPPGAFAVALTASSTIVAGWLFGMTVTRAKDNTSASVPPTTTDDASEGYEVGSRWFVDMGNGYSLVWVCGDATADAAEWNLEQAVCDSDNTVVSIDNDASETTLFTLSIPASLLGTNRKLRVVADIRLRNASGSPKALTMDLEYGSSMSVSAATGNIATGVNDQYGEFVGWILNTSAAAQIGGINLILNKGGVVTGGLSTHGAGTEDSTGALNLVLKATLSAADADCEFYMYGYQVTLIED